MCLQPNKVLLLGSSPPWEEENVLTAATVDSHQSRAPLEEQDNLTILGPSGNHYAVAVPVGGRDWSHMTQTEWSLVKGLFQTNDCTER